MIGARTCPAWRLPRPLSRLDKPWPPPYWRSYSLVFGTAAVALGGLLQVPALGSLHWNAPDALLGLQLAVPILLAGG